MSVAPKINYIYRAKYGRYFTRLRVRIGRRAFYVGQTIPGYYGLYIHSINAETGTVEFLPLSKFADQDIVRVEGVEVRK